MRKDRSQRSRYFCVLSPSTNAHLTMVNPDTVRGMSRLLGNAMSALVLVFALV